MALRLPSLHALRAFEAAARTGSFANAAAELGVTPTAVSHHIRGLEERLGLRLFDRKARRVVLTRDAERLASTCTDAFAAMATALSETVRDQRRQTLKVAMGPILSTRWFTPLLPAFWETFPGVDLNVLHSPSQISPDHIEADVFLAWGDGRWPGMESRLLLEVTTVPVATPELLSRLGKPETPDELTRFPLIHHRDRSGWSEWYRLMLSAAPGPAPVIGQETFLEDANMVLRSALAGQGVALGWRPLIDEELETGQLVPLFEPGIHGSRAYYVLAAKRAHTEPQTADFINWISSFSVTDNNQAVTAIFTR